MGNGEPFESSYAVLSEYHRTIAWTAATNYSPTWHHGHLPHLRILDTLVISAGNYGNIATWWLAASWMSSKL
jgi:hypothetical protein